MVKHTKGPWVVFSNSLNVGVSAPDADVAHCGGMNRPHRSREEEEANARLIAASPAMLGALKETRALVTEAAMTGFRWDDGDWADRLFRNQASISRAIAAAEPTT